MFTSTRELFFFHDDDDDDGYERKNHTHTKTNQPNSVLYNIT